MVCHRGGPSQRVEHPVYDWDARTVTGADPDASGAVVSFDLAAVLHEHLVRDGSGERSLSCRLVRSDARKQRRHAASANRAARRQHLQREQP
ncbi:hypothetical protein [Baekduia soli]|nr:hypothetical protein [Baekduia soli]